MCYFKCDALVITTRASLLKSVAKSSGLFICMTAVYSGELSPLNLQLCRVTKVRNSNLFIFQTVQIVLESQNRGNIGSVLLLWIKACNGWLCSPKGVKEGRESTLILLMTKSVVYLRCSLYMNQKQTSQRYSCTVKFCDILLRKVIYLISNSCFLTGYTQVSSPFLSKFWSPLKLKMQTRQGEAG